MAQKVIVSLVDDLDGKKADEMRSTSRWTARANQIDLSRRTPPNSVVRSHYIEAPAGRVPASEREAAAVASVRPLGFDRNKTRPSGNGRVVREWTSRAGAGIPANVVDAYHEQNQFENNDPRRSRTKARLTREPMRFPGQSMSTPGLKHACGSNDCLAARSAAANSSGRCRSYHGRWSGDRVVMGDGAPCRANASPAAV